MESHCFVPLTPVTFLERCGRYLADNVAILAGLSEVSYGELLTRSRRLAAMLRAAGVARGDRVGILSHNCRQSIEAHYAIPAAGGVIVSFNPWLSAAQIQRQIDFLRPKALLVGGAMVESHHELFPAGGSVPVIVLDEVPGLGDLSRRFACFEVHQYRYGSEIALDNDVVSELDPIAINFTSGTTNDPKGVVYSHRAAYLHAIGQVLMMSMTGSSVYYWSLPMFHVNGWGHMWAVVAAGAQQVVDERPGELEPSIFRQRLATVGATHLAGAPRLIRKLTDGTGTDDASHKGLTVMTGGAAPTADLVKEMKLHGVNLIHQYGLNETCGPFVVCDVKREWGDLPLEEQAKLGMRQGIAAIHVGTGLRVVDDQMRDVSWDGISQGEILMSGNTVALGYVENPEATAAAFRNGWFHSGDVAVVHPDGFLEIKDRLKDLVFVETPYGWENISSLEIENVASRTPGVSDVAVIGLRESEKSAQIVLFYETNAQVGTDAQAIRETCAQSLPAFKVPTHFIHAPIPKTATGKVMKNLLVEEARARLYGRAC